MKKIILLFFLIIIGCYLFRTGNPPMSKLINVDQDTFQHEVLDSKQIVLVELMASWCGPCKMLSPIVEEFAAENPQIKVVKVDVDEAPSLASNYNVRGVPTLIVFHNGKEVRRKVGLTNKFGIEELVEISSE